MKNRIKVISLIFVLGFASLGCSNNNEETLILDTIAPKFFIQSPMVVLTYSTDVGNNYVPFRVTLTA